MRRRRYEVTEMYVRRHVSLAQRLVRTGCHVLPPNPAVNRTCRVRQFFLSSRSGGPPVTLNLLGVSSSLEAMTNDEREHLADCWLAALVGISRSVTCID